MALTERDIEKEEQAGTWPANRAPERLEDWSRFAESDREAGFRFTEDFERFSQHDDIFNRAWWDPAVMSDDVMAFYYSQIHPKPRKADGFTQWDWALVNASWSVARDYAMRGRKNDIREGFLDHFQTFVPRAEQQAPLPTPEETAARVKKVAKFLGADLVGITEFDERWVYTQSSSALSKTRDEKDNLLPEGMTSVIVLGHGMDYGLVESYPSALGASATGREYSREAAIVSSVAGFIEALGYRAYGSSNDTGLTIPHAIKAGLGEYGRNQMVITKEFGPRVRFSKVYTDLPLAHDKPKKYGIHAYCMECTKCADACPPKALPHGPPAAGGPNRSTIKGVVKWSADCEKCFKFWTKMRVDCAICMRVCTYNKDYSKWHNRVLFRLMGTRLRKAMIWLDRVWLARNRVAPKQWWGSA